MFNSLRDVTYCNIHFSPETAMIDPPGPGGIGGHYFTHMVTVRPSACLLKKHARTLHGALWVTLNSPDLFSYISIISVPTSVSLKVRQLWL